MKTKTVTLSYGEGTYGWTDPTEANKYMYRVEKLSNCTEFRPFQMLSKKQVDELCDAPHWQVNIVPVPR